MSRVHAEIVVNTVNPVNPLPNKCSHLSSSIHIRDCSKYGTFISKNDGAKKKVHELPNKETALENGDLVSFGTGTATYKYVKYLFSVLLFHILCHSLLIFRKCSCGTFLDLGLYRDGNLITFVCFLLMSA